jgi:membrane AbrB-like protein
MGSIFAEEPFFSKVLTILTTGLVAIPGGLLFSFLHIPLPWMLGPLTITLIHHALRGKGTRWPVGFRNAGLIVIGYSMGRTVTVETTEQILINLPGMAAVTLLIVLFSLATGYLTHRQTGISLASGILGSVPGGLAQMVLMAEEIEDADVATVTLMQMARVLAVLFIVPFVATYGIVHLPAGPPSPAVAAATHYGLAVLPALLMAPLGAWLAARLNFPIPFLLGPIFATTAAVLIGFPAPPVPRPLINTAQLFFGVYLGITISLESLRGVGKVLPWAIGGSVALVAFTYLVGFGLTLVTPASLLTAFLSTAPGGITEMGIVALTLGADVAFVLAYQLFRLFCILLAAPLLLRRRFKR